MRLLNIMVIGALILAASFVYKIKFDSTLQSERAASLRNELRQERDAIATLRAEWAKLEAPSRIQSLVSRHLALKPVDPAQFDGFDRLPERPSNIVRPRSPDPIGAMIDDTAPGSTGSVRKPQ